MWLAASSQIEWMGLEVSFRRSKHLSEVDIGMVCNVQQQQHDLWAMKKNAEHDVDEDRVRTRAVWIGF